MISILSNQFQSDAKCFFQARRLFSHRSHGSGVQVQHCDSVVVGVGHVKQLPTAADADPTGFVKEGFVERWTQSVAGLARPC